MQLPKYLRCSSAFLSILLGATLPSHARLGETEAQSAARYGAPVEKAQPGAEPNGGRPEGGRNGGGGPLLYGAVEWTYNFEGWRIRTAYVDRVAVRIEYSRDQGGPGTALTPAEINAILEAEKGKFYWREAREERGRGPGRGGGREPQRGNRADNPTRWERADHATAEIRRGNVLRVETRDAEEIAERLVKTLAKTPAKTPAKPGAPAGPVPKF